MIPTRVLRAIPKLLSMHQVHPAYLERELKRWTRPNAHHFVRPDWRRFVTTGSELAALYERYERKYSPDQPRVPAGSSEGGRWTSGGGGAASASSGDTTTELSAASQKLGGHHYIPKGVYDKLPLPAETKAVFDDAKTGRLQVPSSNWYDMEHRAYNDAVEEQLNRFMETNRISPEKMTPDQAQEFVRQVLSSSEPRIRNFNMRMQIREIMHRVFRRVRGTE